MPENQPRYKVTAVTASKVKDRKEGPEAVDYRPAVSTLTTTDEQPFAKVLAALEARCPDYIDEGRWRQCVSDAKVFLATWADQAHALGWTAADLFGLQKPPAHPHPSYSRLSRYDATGLLWLLKGQKVIALTATTATLMTPTGGVLTYRKLNKPGYGPLGDSLDDFE
jgi:hypothetical protein